MNPARRRAAIEEWLNLSGRAYYVALGVGLFISIMSVASARDLIVNIWDGLNDYLQFYSGARLAGTPYLYDAAHTRQVQIAAVGGYGVSAYYVRLPFYAGLLSPLGRLPYRPSFWLWQCISLAALVGFMALWRIPSRRLTALACCWSLPLLLVFVMGQDVTLLLLVLAAAFWFHDRSATGTGLILSLLAIKFHLFLLLPLLLVAQRRWKTAIGFSVGCAVVIALSFPVGGSGWPAQMLAQLSSRGSFAREDVMPNIRGLLQPFDGQLLPELALAAAIAGSVWVIARRADFSYGMAGVLIGSLLISHHAGPQDTALLIPALLIVAAYTLTPYLNWTCVLLFSPLPYMLLTHGHGLAAGLVLLLLTVLFGMAVEARRVFQGPSATPRMPVPEGREVCLPRR